MISGFILILVTGFTKTRKKIVEVLLKREWETENYGGMVEEWRLWCSGGPIRGTRGAMALMIQLLPPIGNNNWRPILLPLRDISAFFKLVFCVTRLTKDSICTNNVSLLERGAK